MSVFPSSRMNHWKGSIERRDECELSVISILLDQAEERGGSLPFLALASNQGEYWIKTLGTEQGDRVLVTEQVVSRCGALIGAPVCKTSLIAIPEEFDGEQLSNGRVLKQGIAHASQHVANTIFGKFYEPQYRDRDDNEYRHAFIFALHDWCWGDDLQWLYQTTTDLTTFSHDHGHFLPGGPAWDCEQLAANAGEPHEIGMPADGISKEALAEAASNLEQVNFDSLHAIMQTIPRSWPVSDTDLEHLGCFLECRTAGVAARLRSTADRLGS